MHTITKQLCGKNTNHSGPVKEKGGDVVPTEHQQVARWVQHFQEVLNRPEPVEPAEPPAEDILKINIAPSSKEEVRVSMKAMKSGKAPDIDSIHAEILKADISTATRVLADLFRTVWTLFPTTEQKASLSSCPKR